MVISARVRIIASLFLFFGLLLMVRLYFLQIVHGTEYTDKAERQYLGSDKLYNRGTIYFKNKDGSLLSAATLKTGYILSLNTIKLKEPLLTFDKLKTVLTDLNSETFFLKAAKTNDPYEELATHLTEEQAQAISAFSLPGVEIQKERWRFYPGGKLAANIVGMVGKDGKSLGYGLEKYYDATLLRDPKNTYVNFFAEIFSTINKAVSSDEKLEGDIVTTVEPSVQSFLEDTLEKVAKEYQSKLSGGIIINPSTGAVYALAINPTFDPNNFSQEKVSVFNNPFVEGVYEMGSIIKPLTMATGLDVGVVSARTTYNDLGSVTLDGLTFHNYDGRGRGVVPMQEVLNQSLNTGVAYVVDKVGDSRFAEYLYNFGLDKETGIDLPGEIYGQTENLKSKRRLEYATASFGQGIALTPIETARALCALGNGGFLITPHLVEKINYSVGGYKTVSYEQDKTSVLKPSTSEEITRMLVEVFDKALKKGIYKNPHYSIAAKTGTAQIANPKGGGYYTDRYLHSFFGYFPAYKPQFLVLLYTVEPQNVNFASETLSKPFVDLSNFLINYYELPPDR